jgi:hypothetical protein
LYIIDALIPFALCQKCYCMFLCCALESEQQSVTEEEDQQQTPRRQQPQPQHAILHRDFTATQLAIVFDPYRRTTLTRQIGPDTVCEPLSALLRWAGSYIALTVAFHAADSREQTELHSLFYTVCQAAFYIMCFRGAEVMEFHADALQGYKNGRQQQMNNNNNGGQGEEEDDSLAFLPDPEHIDLGSKR